MARLAYLGFWPVPPTLGRSRPDYVGLVLVLSRLRNLPDCNGRTVLDYDEAWWIRYCGFRARAGVNWRCPPLPHRLVTGNPLLRHLTNRPDLLPRGRRPGRRARQSWPLATIEQKIFALLRRTPYHWKWRELQHRLWRLGSVFFNQVLESLIAAGRVTEYEGWVFPVHPEDLHYFVQR